MPKKETTLSVMASVMNNPKLKDKAFAKAKGQVRGGGLLDLVRTVGEESSPLEDKGWIKSKRPETEEIDRSVTSPEMILTRKAILKDGRRVTWPAGRN
jgi:hypothetical protein